jgi:hypothetical protein
MNPVFESMCRLQIGDLRVRIWRDEPSLEAAYTAENADLHDWAQSKRVEIVLHGEKPHPLALFGELAKIERIAAVEIIDQDMQGTVVYNNWP